MASKTTPVNINGSVFHMAEPAYHVFSDYLKTVKVYFAQHEGKEEIVADLESRMAEHFSEQLSPGKQVILEKDVQKLIEVMGRVEDFAAEEEGVEIEEKTKVRKRFYRDPNHRVIAGVCAGLANYFQLDVRLIRLVFFVSIFFGGLGIWLYGLMWILVPEAQTTAEKEEMAGYRFDLAAIAKDVEEKVKDIKVPKKVGQGIGKFFEALGQAVTTLVKAILKLILFALKLISIFVTPVLILVTVAFTLLMLSLAFHFYPFLIELPLELLANRASFYLFLIGAYVAGLVVLIALISVFMSPLKNRWLFTAGKGVALMSLFLVGGLLAFLGGVDLAPRIESAIKNELRNESKKKVVFEDLPAFKTLFIHHPIREATIVPGEEYKVEFKGNFCKGSFKPEVIGETLRLNRKKILPYNPLCDALGVEVLITVPDFEGLSAWDSSLISIKGFDFDQLNVGLFQHNQLNLGEGSAQNLKAYIEDDSLILGLPFKVKKAHIDAFGHAMAEVWVTDALYARAHNDSVIRYKGTPQTSFSEEMESGVIQFQSFGNLQDINDLPPGTVMEAQDSFNSFYFNDPVRFDHGADEIPDLENELETEIPEVPTPPEATMSDGSENFNFEPLSPLDMIDRLALSQDCKGELKDELQSVYGSWIFSTQLQFPFSESDIRELAVSESCKNKLIEKLY